MAEDEVENPKPAKRRAKQKGVKEDTQQSGGMSSSNTNVKIDELLQQVVAKSTKDASDAKKKKKKKPKNVEDENVLESLRNGEGIEVLRKDKDSTILANTYDPDDNIKSGKSNKQRQRQRDTNKNANIDDRKQNVDEQDSAPVTGKSKKKGKKKDFLEYEIERELAVIAEPQSEKPQKKPRKKVKSPSQSVEVVSQLEDTNEENSTVMETPRKKKKKKPKIEDKEEEDKDETEESREVATPKKKKKKKQTEEDDEEEEESQEAVTKKKKKKPKVEEDDEKEDEEEEPENDKKKKKPKMKVKGGKEEEEEKKEKKKSKEGKLEKKMDTEEENEPVPVKSKQKKKKKDEAEEEKEEEVQEEETPAVKAKPRKKKKAKEEEQTEEEEEEETPVVKAKPRKKNKAKEEEQTEEEEEEETPVVKAKPRKKKKVKDEEQTEEEEEEKSKDEDETKTDKKKKKKKKSAEDKEETDGDETALEPKDIEDEGEVMGLLIHRTDKLKNDFRILHPVIRVHVVNEETGENIPKQHPDRAVTSYFETSNEAVKTILPMMTQPFDFKERKSTIPVWEDLLMFNENFNYFTQPNPKVILLFELLDFVSMNTASRQFSEQKEEGGWHRIAWAFLKVLGKNGKVNVGNKLRLQLFVPPDKTQRVPGQPEVYQWWKSGERIPYSSTLYVTLKSIEPPREVPGAMRSLFATQKELGHMTYKDLKTLNWSGREKTRTQGRTLTTWTRLLGQLCRVPNILTHTLTAGKKGCFVIKFSNDGRSLACACQDGTDNPILVYEIPSGELKGKFQGHFGIIYSLSWNKSDTQIVSASNDGTSRIWDIQKLGESQIRLLPHPGFVYTAEFHPRVDSIVVTGGYDEVVRVWDISTPDDANVLQQEMEEHHGHINSICFDNDDGQKMYTADSVGTILIWNVYVTEQASRKHFVRDWNKFLEIKDPELKDTPINFIKMHPSGRRLLVHGRNNAIYMFDLRVQRVMQKYFGADNLKEKICSTITPCGSFVFSGSEDGKVYAWNTDTGDQVAVYTQLNYQMPVTDVHYHPRDHMLAICSLGDNHPVYIYKYDPLIAQTNATSARPTSPVERTEIEDIETARASVLKDLTLQSARSKVMSKDEFETKEKARYHRVVKKLENATMQMGHMPGMVVPESLLSSRMDTIGRSGVQSSWKMPFDTSYSLTPRSSAIPPGVLSPHAPVGSGTQLSTQITSHRGYMRAADGDWRPGFSEVGRHGARSQSPTYYGRPPHLSLNTSHGKPQFTFESPVGKKSSLKQVVAIYDYRAQRSDELNLYKGDVITVLYKDNENWWMGELLDGQQGFFPSNYVTEDDDPDSFRRGSKAPSVSSSGNVTAIKTKSGELRFVSGGEESDSETPRPGKKRASIDLVNNGDRSSLPPQSSKQQLNDSIEALLDQYESVA